VEGLKAKGAIEGGFTGFSKVPGLLAGSRKLKKIERGI